MNCHLPKNILILFIASLTSMQFSFARILISSTRFGNKAYINPTGWTFTGVNMYISMGNHSTGYPGASSGANLTEGSKFPFINTAGDLMQKTQVGTSTATLQVSTINFTNIRLSFAMRRSSLNYLKNASYKLEWSINDTNYFPIAFTASSATDWNLAKGTGLTLPAGAENQPSLFLRWTFTRTTIHYNIKIDDFKVKGDTLCTPVAILSQPVDPLPVCVNSGTAIFSVTAAGSGNINYQWQKDAINITDGGIYSGAQTSTLILTDPDYLLNENKFRCIVSNCSAGYILITDEAVLHIQTLQSDVNRDGFIDNNDFILFIQSYNTFCSGCPEDINKDGVINVLDFLKMLSEYDQACQ